MKILLTEEQLREGVERLAIDLKAHYAGQPLTIIGVLTGSIVLLADLIRRLDMPLSIGVVQARSYRGRSTEPGSLVINSELLPDLKGRHVLILDDIFDTGGTLMQLLEEVDGMGPATVHTAVLLRKVNRGKVALQPDFVGFEIPDEFVVGYGLDFNDAYRNLPYVAALSRDELQAETNA